MDISYDKKNLISCGKDGTICIFSIQECDSRGIIDFDGNLYSTTREVLVTKN